ncbi:MAG: hypothetical protein K8S98_01915 [Planctomycetes bacterium]|nr:hypothetical protein [Planctomycetota bacterium]
MSRSRLLSVATAFPEHVYDRLATARVLGELFPSESRANLEDLIERSGIEERRLLAPPERLRAEFDASRRGSTSVERELAERAARTALERSALAAEVVDVLIVVADSRSAPAGLELELCVALDLRRNVKRVPLDAGGACAGSSALALAASVADSGCTALVVVVASASPVVPLGDADLNTLRAATLGNGAAAAVIAPSDTGWRFAAVGSWLAPRALEFVEGRASTLVARHLPGALVRFLSENERSLADVGVHVVHGPSRPSLERYAALFRVGDEALRFSRRALAKYGDLAAVSVLAMLELVWCDADEVAGEREVLAVATGPGARFEFLLFDRRPPC